MVNNPWSELPSRIPFVLHADLEAIQEFNAKPNRKDEHVIRVDVLPEPFVGSKDAPVLLLSNNPGYGEEAVHKQESAFMDRMRANLHHQPVAYPFVYLDPALSEPLKKWWRPKLKHSLERFGPEFGPEVVARSILNVVYFPYASQRFKHGKLNLDSQQYGFQLVRAAMERNAVIVRFRKGMHWFKAVKGLEGYARLYRVKNFQNPTISPKNCEHFEEIVKAIREAEKNK